MTPDGAGHGGGCLNGCLEAEPAWSGLSMSCEGQVRSVMSQLPERGSGEREGTRLACVYACCPCLSKLSMGTALLGWTLCVTMSRTRSHHSALYQAQGLMAPTAARGLLCTPLLP